MSEERAASQRRRTRRSSQVTCEVACEKHESHILQCPILALRSPLNRGFPYAQLTAACQLSEANMTAAAFSTPTYAEGSRVLSGARCFLPLS